MKSNISRVIQYILIGAFALLVIGIIWFAVTQNRQSKPTANATPTPTPVSQTSPASTPTQLTPTPTATAPSQGQVVRKPVTPPKQQVTQPSTSTQTTTTEASAGFAWARAWVDENGVAHTETRTE